MSTVRNNIKNAITLVAESAKRSGRLPQDITLMAVSKRIAPSLVMQAVDSCVTCFGENRVQEAIEKIPLLPSHLDWHFIGALQKNKIRKILPLVSSLHGIDSLGTAAAVDRIASELGFHPRVYLQVNVANEQSKQGFSPAELERDIASVLELPRLQVLGLMTIPPFSPDPEKTRPHFELLRILRDRVEQHHGVKLPGLSMGMSNDFPIAIEEGSTIVRLGTTIFGPRNPA